MNDNQEAPVLAQLLREQLERNAELERKLAQLHARLQLQEDEPDYWTVDEAAQAMGLHTNTIYNAIKRGDLEGRYTKVGNAIRLHRSSMLSWSPSKSTSRRRPRKIS